MEEWIGIGNRSYSQFQAWLDLELLSFQIEFPKLYFWKALHCVLYTFYGRILRAGRTAQPRTSLRPASGEQGLVQQDGDWLLSLCSGSPARKSLV